MAKAKKMLTPRCSYSIPKSSFYNINLNILILPINTSKKYLKYSIHFRYYESNFPYREMRKFHDIM